MSIEGQGHLQMKIKTGFHDLFSARSNFATLAFI